MCILADSAAIGLSSRPACAGQCRSSQPTTARLRRLVSAWRLAAKKKGGKRRRWRRGRLLSAAGPGLGAAAAPQEPRPGTTVAPGQVG